MRELVAVGRGHEPSRNSEIGARPMEDYRLIDGRKQKDGRKSTRGRSKVQRISTRSRIGQDGKVRIGGRGAGD